MLKKFEVELSEKIEISTDGNTKSISVIEISKPVVKNRNQYINFYQTLTKSVMSSRPSEEDRKKVDEYENEDEEKEEEEFNARTATAIGTMHLSEQTIRELFKFLSIGDKENAVCKIFGEKISDLELDLLKEKLEDIDLATIIGGIMLNFLPLLQLKKK